MLVGNISLEQLFIGLTGGAEASGSGAMNKTGEAQEDIFGSLMAGPLKATSKEGLDNPIFKSLILKGLQNPEISEQIKNALTSGGKISLEINNPKDIIAGLLALSQDMDTTLEVPSLDDNGASINIEDLLKSIDVKEVVVDNQQVQEVLNNFSEKLTSMLEEQLAAIENSDIENKEELVQFIEGLEESLGIIEQVFPEEVQVDVSNINLEGSVDGEIELVADSEVSQMIMEPNVQVDEEVVPVEQEQPVGALESIKAALAQILEKVIDKVNSKQETKVVINTEHASAKTDEQLLEKFGLLKNIDPENLKNIDVKIAPNPSVVNKMEAQLNKILVDVKTVLNQELNGKELNLEKIAESLKTNLESIVNSTKQLSESNDIKVVIPKNTLKADLNPVLNKDLIKPQSIEMEPVKLEKLEVPKVQPDTSKASQMDKSIEVSKIAPFKPTESIGNILKEKDNLLEALIDKKVQKSEIQQARSENSSNSNLFQNNSMSSDKGLFNMFVDSQSDPAISGLKSAGNVFAGKMSSVNAATNPAGVQTPAQQLADKIRENYGKNQIEVSLNPDRLGKVKVNVAMQRGALVASIVAETAKAMDSLKSGVESLRNALAESGLNVDRVVVTQADQSSNASNNNDPNNNSSKENASSQQEKQNGSEANQNKAEEFKDTMEFIQTKQAENPAKMDKTLTDGNTTDQNTSDILTNQTATNEDNYIDTEKGFVNYRV